MLSDKDAEGAAALIAEASDSVIVTAPGSDRAMDPTILYDIVRKHCSDVRLVPAFEDAADAAEDAADGRIILITGSFRMAEDAIRWLRKRYARSST